MNPGSEARAALPAEGHQLTSFFNKTASICRYLVVLIGVAGILGILIDLPYLRAIIPGTQPLSFTGSICFLVAGLALDVPKNSRGRLALFISGIFLVISGLLTLAEYKFNVSILFDEIFLKQQRPLNSGRMSISGSLNFVLVGVFFLFKWKKKKNYTEIPVLMILMIASMVATANLLRISNQEFHTRIFSQPVNATIGFILLSTSALFQRSCCGFVSTFASKAHTGRSGFILLNQIIAILAVITFFQFIGVNAKWYSFNDSLPVVMVVYMFVFGLLVEKYTRLLNKYELQKEMLFQEVQSKNEEVKTNLRELAIYLQNSKEEESMHLAREIHDQLGQELAIMKFHANILQEELNGSSSPSLGIISRYLDGSIELVKKISTELRPQLLDDIGLIEAMQWHASEVQRIFNIDIITDINVSSLPAEINNSAAVFRIFQETMNNIAKHANANQVYIHVSQQAAPGILRISITDDGIGFDPLNIKTKRKHGLTAMTERVIGLKGNCQIISHPGEGTCVIVEIPLHDDCHWEENLQEWIFEGTG